MKVGEDSGELSAEEKGGFTGSGFGFGERILSAAPSQSPISLCSSEMVELNGPWVYVRYVSKTSTSVYQAWIERGRRILFT
jgi:hypothetical protein